MATTININLNHKLVIPTAEEKAKKAEKFKVVRKDGAWTKVLKEDSDKDPVLVAEKERLIVFQKTQVTKPANNLLGLRLHEALGRVDTTPTPTKVRDLRCKEGKGDTPVDLNAFEEKLFLELGGE